MTRTRYKIFEGDHFPYFLTLTTVNWLPLFSNPTAANFVFDSLRYLQSNNQLIIFAYVLMENHLHLIASGENLNHDLSRFKSYTARKCIDLYKNQNNEFILKQLGFFKQPHRSDRKYQFWQEGNQPKRIHNDRMMQQKVDYIHMNPVRRGYVDLPEQWRYSSARTYADEPGLLAVCVD